MTMNNQLLLIGYLILLQLMNKDGDLGEFCRPIGLDRNPIPAASSNQNLYSLFRTIGPIRRPTIIRGSTRSIVPYLVPTTSEKSGSISERCHEFGESSNGSYISDVFQCGDEGKAEQLCKNFQFLLKEQYPRGLFIVSKHGTHVHTAHDCAYSDRSCRCSIFQKAQGGLIRSKRPFRRAPRIQSLEISDYANILFYFSNQGRKIYEIRLAGQMEEVSFGNEDLGEREIEGSGTTEQMESCFNVDGPELRRKITYEYISARSSKAHRAISERKPKKGQKILQLILNFCMDNPCSPINGVCTHEKWLTNPDLQFLGLEDRNVKAALNTFSNRLCSWTFDDFNVMYTRDDCKPVFTANIGNYTDYYYNIDDSLEVMNKLLLFQFRDDEEKILDFVTKLYNILERKIPKRNCLLIQSPPSGGKNYFVDVFIDYLLNKGQFANANKHNMFAFQDAYAKRIILWNEPNYESSKTDMLKMICAGDAYSVNVKQKSNTAVSRTPIIMLTNSRISLMSDPAFKDRIYMFTWAAAPFLKDYTKKPNPLAAYALFKYYNLVKDNIQINV